MSNEWLQSAWKYLYSAPKKKFGNSFGNRAVNKRIYENVSTTPRHFRLVEHDAGLDNRWDDLVHDVAKEVFGVLIDNGVRLDI